MRNQIKPDCSALEYSRLLNRYIDKTYSIIQDDIPVTEWILYKYCDYQKFNFFNQLPINMFGCCNINEKRIWVSDRTIMIGEEFTINVIIDELTHLKTGRGHHDDNYKNQFRKYHQLYDTYKNGKKPLYYSRPNAFK
jgi:hypothetical protein